MPYFSLGSLEDQQNITTTETITLLHQSLQALEYLHSHQLEKKRVAHRDIKPANILVVSRSPFHIKLADFGLAQDCFDLITHCGTFLYAAPEVHSNQLYTTAVDVWSLGVVVFQYAYGLPEEATQRSIPTTAHTWCEQLVDEVNQAYSHPLKYLLSAHLIRMEASQRHSAGQCLEKASAMKLFDNLISDSGNIPANQQTAVNNIMSDNDSSTTIILGALWGAQETSNVRDDNRKIYYGAQHTTGILEFPIAQEPRGANRSLFDGFGSAGEQWAGSVEAPGDLHRVPAKAQATCSTSYKWQQTRAIASSKKSPRRGRDKSQQPDIRHKDWSVLCTSAVSGDYLGNDAQSIQFRTMYDAVLDLLRNCNWDTVLVKL